MQPWLFRWIVPSDTPILGGQDLSIPLFFMLSALGFIAGVFVLLRQSEKANLNSKSLLDLATLFLFLSIPGGRLIYVLLGQTSFYLNNPAAFFDVWQGGLSFWGAFGACALAGWIVARRKGVDFFALADVFMPALSLGLVFGWAGALASGTGYGKPIDFPFGLELPWGLVFYGGQVPDLLRGIQLHPSQVYLAIMNLGIFFKLSRLNKHPTFPGEISLVWGMLFGLGTLILDVFRFDFERGLFMGGWVSVPQLLGGALFVACAIVYKMRKNGDVSKLLSLGALGSPFAGS